MDKRVVVFEDDNINYDLPAEPKEFLKYWESKIALIPAEYVDEAIIDVEAESVGDYSSALFVSIYYCRPETPEERVERLDVDKCRDQKIEDREREELRLLKLKYEG